MVLSLIGRCLLRKPGNSSFWSAPRLQHRPHPGRSSLPGQRDQMGLVHLHARAEDRPQRVGEVELADLGVAQFRRADEGQRHQLDRHARRAVAPAAVAADRADKPTYTSFGSNSAAWCLTAGATVERIRDAAGSWIALAVMMACWKTRL